MLNDLSLEYDLVNLLEKRKPVPKGRRPGKPPTGKRDLESQIDLCLYAYDRLHRTCSWIVDGHGESLPKRGARQVCQRIAEVFELLLTAFRDRLPLAKQIAGSE